MGLSSIGSSQRSQLGLTGKTRRSRLLVLWLALLVPFLPFFRVKDVLFTTVGGAYLFAAELWAPFIPRAGRTPGSRIIRDVLAWIMGLGSARLERCRGWFELRELDDMATGMPLRAVGDAICHGWYLKMPFFSYSRILKMRARKLTRLGWDNYRKRFVSLGLALRVYTMPDLQLSGVRETRA